MSVKKNSLRIGIDARCAEEIGGGVSRYIQELTKFILSKKDIPILISTRKINHFPYPIQNIVLPVKGHWFIWEQIQLPIRLFGLKLDIYHAAGNWGVPLLYSKPTVLTVHDIIPRISQTHFDQTRFPLLSKLLYNFRLSTSVKLSKYVIATTQYTKNDLKKYYGVDDNKVKVIPMAVSGDFFQIKDKDDEQVLSKYKINRPYILSHGGIDRRKNLSNLIQSFALLIKMKNDKESNKLNLVITGSNEQLVEEYKALANSIGISDAINFIGWVTEEEICTLVRNSLVIVYPTTIEGFGMPLLEAMASGKPVVTSDMPVLRQIGENVPIYVKPNDINNITLGLSKALQGIPDKTIKEGVEIARRYSWDNTMNATYHFYEDLASRH